jgi:hypothetical protein
MTIMKKYKTYLMEQIMRLRLLVHLLVSLSLKNFVIV